jgi:hypothetical protein
VSIVLPLQFKIISPLEEISAFIVKMAHSRKSMISALIFVETVVRKATINLPITFVLAIVQVVDRVRVQ